MCNDKLMFYKSIENCDIWFSQNTVDGKTKYLFYFQGVTYERDSDEEITKLAQKVYGDWFRKANGRSR